MTRARRPTGPCTVPGRANEGHGHRGPHPRGRWVRVLFGHPHGQPVSALCRGDILTAGVCWGVAIMALDRWLILTIRRQPGRIATLLQALP
jgi:hypothetical protein